MDAAHVEHILPFEIRTVTPSQHLHTDIVLAAAHIFCDIKLRIRIGTLRITQIMAVDPDKGATVDAVKMDEHPFAVPCLRQCKCTAIRANRIRGVLTIIATMNTNERWIVIER